MLRPELLPPQVDSRRLATLIQRAYERVRAGERAADAAADLERYTGRRIDGGDLVGWYGSMEAGEAAAMLLTSPTHELRSLQLSRDELVEVARRLMPSCSEWDQANEHWWAELLEANVPHPDGASLAYHPPDGRPAARWDPTPEELVDLALSYRAVELS